MRKYIREYIKQMRTEIDALDPAAEPEKAERMKEGFLQKLSFFQHERLCHFLTCFMVVNALFISLGLIMLSGLTEFGIVSFILLVLTAFYIEHYFFLENSVQKMYRMYDEIVNKISGSDKD